MPVDCQAAIALRLNHQLSYSEIAAIQGVSRQAIHQAIQHLIPTEQLPDYKANRADILSHAQLQLLSNGLTPTKLQKISTRDAIVSMGILYDKERIERGLATEIVDVRSMVLTVDAKIEELQAVLSRKVRPDEPERGGGVE